MQLRGRDESDRSYSTTCVLTNFKTRNPFEDPTRGRLWTIRGATAGRSESLVHPPTWDFLHAERKFAAMSRPPDRHKRTTAAASWYLAINA